MICIRREKFDSVRVNTRRLELENVPKMLGRTADCAGEGGEVVRN